MYRTLGDQVNTLTLPKLKYKTAEVMGSLDEAEAIVNMIADRAVEDSDVERGEVVDLPTPVRYPNIKIRRSTQLVLQKKKDKAMPDRGEGLHMSKMSDYCGDDLLICQAPLRDQFVSQWRAIWQEKVKIF